jgi:hypothetical protein
MTARQSRASHQAAKPDGQLTNNQGQSRSQITFGQAVGVEVTRIFQELQEV